MNESREQLLQSAARSEVKPFSGMLSYPIQQPEKSAAGCKTKRNEVKVTRLPGNDEISGNNPISEEETIPSDDVAEMHKVMRKSDQTGEVAARTCGIQVRITRRSNKEKIQCRSGESRRA